MSFSVSGKTAIVTGSASGIGLAIARHLLDKGANVMFADVDEARLEAEVGEEARAEGPIRMFAGDLTEKLTIANLLSATIDAFDRVDILVNASRRMVVSELLNPEADGVEELWRHNVLSSLRMSQMTAKRMIQHAQRAEVEPGTMLGSIINLSSIAAQATRPDLSDWLAKPHRVEGFQTLPGIFSADGPDRGSVLLAGALPAKLGGKVADLGAGWGFLAAEILKRPGVKKLDLVEAEADALDCAKVNITDPRARFHWADATTWRPETLLDAVVTNPPFHTGRAADPALGAAFIRAARRMLAPDGSLWLVANRHLPYDAVLADCFLDFKDVAGDGAFRVIHAIKPRRDALRAKP